MIKSKKEGINRIKNFKEYAKEYAQAKKKIPTGLKNKDRILEQKKRILKVLKGTMADWDDWKWQMRKRISDVDTLSKIFNMSKKEKIILKGIGEHFRWGFSPFYASLMDPDDPECPIRKQMIPDEREMLMTGIPDFSGEQYTSPTKKCVRWYPDRVIIYTTNICSSFCRHCLRRRHIGETDKATPNADILEAIKYIKKNPEIRDVLLTGGDPLTYSDDKVDWLLTELGKIKHLEIKRIGSRMPTTIPQRITPKLCKILEKHSKNVPLYINIQANHPLEVNEEMIEACDMLVKAGVPLGNQTVLLRGINDDKHVMKVLCHDLLKAKVRPYYIYHCQGTIGIEHLRTPVETGIGIIENLRGHTTGFAVPSYIITPSGLGKTPLSPQYHISSGEEYITLRNWEGIQYKYDNPHIIKEFKAVE